MGRSFLKLMLMIGACIGLIESAIGGETLKLRVIQAPPLYYQNDQMIWTGHDFTIAKRVAEKAGYELQIISRPWKRGLLELKHGRIDMMMSLTKNDERSKDLNWIGPVRYEDMALIVRKSDRNLKITSIDELKAHVIERGLPIGYLRGSRFDHNPEFQKLIDEQEENNLTLPLSNIDQQFKMLAIGRVFGIVQTRLLSKYRIERNSKWLDLVPHKFSVYKAPVYFGISKKSGEPLYQRMNQAYLELERTGAFSDLEDRSWD